MEPNVTMNEERRFLSRLFAPYSARLWGVDIAGQAWQEDVILENLSAAGLYLRLNRSVEKDAPVAVTVSLSNAPVLKAPPLLLTARGVVRRTDTQPDGSCGVAMEFSRRQIV